MADVRLRDLERAASTGDPSARAELLNARLRVGTLDRQRVELAAFCGDEAARLVVPLSGIKHPAKDYDDRCHACDDLGAQVAS